MRPRAILTAVLRKCSVLMYWPGLTYIDAMALESVHQAHAFVTWHCFRQVCEPPCKALAGIVGVEKALFFCVVGLMTGLPCGHWWFILGGIIFVFDSCRCWAFLHISYYYPVDGMPHPWLVSLKRGPYSASYSTLLYKWPDNVQREGHNRKVHFAVQHASATDMSMHPCTASFSLSKGDIVDCRGKRTFGTDVWFETRLGWVKASGPDVLVPFDQTDLWRNSCDIKAKRRRPKFGKKIVAFVKWILSFVQGVLQNRSQGYYRMSSLHIHWSSLPQRWALKFKLIFSSTCTGLVLIAHTIQGLLSGLVVSVPIAGSIGSRNPANDDSSLQDPMPIAAADPSPALEESANSSIDGVSESRAADSADNSGEECCVLCMDAERSHAVIPCGHQCLCGTCAAVLVPPQTKRRKRFESALCPLCRAPARMTVQIFR